MPKTTKPVRWTRTHAAAEFNLDAATLSKRLLAASIALQASYTAYLLGSTFNPNEKNDDETIKARMVAAEKVYLALTVLQAIGLVGGIALFLVEMFTKKTAGAVNLFMPTQVPNITVNASGIKLQAGSNFIVVTKFGIVLNGILIENGGQTMNSPLIKPSTLSAIQVEESVNFFGALADL